MQMDKFNHVCTADTPLATMAVPEETETTRFSTQERVRQKCVWLCKKLTVFLFSYVGLTCMVICYSLLGAVLFQALESWNEKEVVVQITTERGLRLNELWDITNDFYIFSKDNWTEQASKVLKKFERDIYKATKELGWDGKTDIAVGEPNWSFAGSLLYSVTVITTIGYGHITPKTWAGRLITIMYALIGIPLTLLCLANIGKFLGKGFRVIYNKIPSFNKRKSFYVATRQNSKYSEGTTPIVNTAHTDGHTDESIITKYTVEHKDKVPARVPIVVCFLLVVAYILLGTILFTLWEQQWSVLGTAYFCFITLSTIGFGDFVPGHSTESWASQPKQVICTMYLLFGLALLAMCFELVQDQVRDLAKKIGVMIKLLDDDKSSD